MARLDKVLAGTQITDEYTYRTGSTALGLLHDAFLASTVVVRTEAGGGGTLLELTTDYTLSAEDSRLTTEAGATVYTKLAVVNGTYQNTPLYISYKCVADYNRASDINNRGRKIGLDACYVSSDLIRVKPGSVEVNDVMVTKTTATDFTTGATNFPGAGSWVYICSDISGTLSLEAATGAGTARPSDACFQLAGSSVGYDDIGKFGYYFNPGKRIIAAAHRVSATSWYFINLFNGSDEEGENSRGIWERRGKKLYAKVRATSTAGSASTWTFPDTFAVDTKIIMTGASMGGSGSSYVVAFAVPSTTACGYSVFGSTTGNTAGATLVGLNADGDWRA